MSELNPCPDPDANPSYGIDAPGVIRNLFIFGILGFLISCFFPVIRMGPVIFDTRGFIWMGIACTLMSILMLVYSLSGKYRHRDRMLKLVQWSGEEQVLDVGTGKGLLLIGAAKKLTTGKATGIDIWNAEDLTGNKASNAECNAKIEGVEDKITIRNENAMSMSFADQHFDVVVSNLCLHNIYDKPGRKAACSEISRVLKSGGTAIISDFKHTREYRKNFVELGLDVTLLSANYITTFPPLTILVVKKA